MQPIWLNVAALAVALIFYLWKSHRQILERRRRAVRDRVTYMLWVMAEEQEGAEAQTVGHVS
jgi:hypothetical protein